MRIKLLLWILVILLLMVNVNASCEGIHLKLNTDTTNQPDEIGNNNGTVFGPGAWFNSSGKLDGSYQFNDNDSWINMSNVSSTNIMSMTIWAKTNDNSIGARVISSGAGNHMCIQQVGGNVRGICNDGTNRITGTIPISNNNWHMLTIVHTATQCQIWVNNTPSSAVTTNAIPDFSYVALGGWSNTECWDGQLDDYKFYPFALTTDNISALYNGGSPPEELCPAGVAPTNQSILLENVTNVSVTQTTAIILADSNVTSNASVKINGLIFTNDSFTLHHRILLTGLTGGTAYAGNITVYAEDNQSTFSNVSLSFITLSIPTNQSIAVYSPRNESVTATGVTLKWDTNVTTNSTLLFNSTQYYNHSFSKNTTYSFTDLNPSTTYYWNFTGYAEDNQSTSVFNGTFSFATPNAVPVISDYIINSTNNDNFSSGNWTVSYVVTDDDSVYNTTWYNSSSKQAVLVMDFNNGSANDLTGYGNDGTVTGATIGTGQDGSKAYDFDGSAYISVPHDDSISFDNTSDRTFSFWVNAPAQGDSGRILQKGSNYYGHPVGTPPNDYQFKIYDGANMGLITLSNILDETWHYCNVVVSRTDQKMYGYIDGALVYTDADISNVGNTSGTDVLYIGSAGTKNYLNGSLDNIQIDNYAHSPEQILSDYNNEQKLVSQETNDSETWQANTFVSDGFPEYASESKTFTILSPNNAPNMNYSRISPTPTATESDNLLGYCNATDIEGQNITYEYRWYLNNNLNKNGYSTVVFQETSTTTRSDLSTCSIYFNYTIPDYLISAVSKIKMGSYPVANHTVPNDCLNNILQLKAITNRTGAEAAYNHFYCYNYSLEDWALINKTTSSITSATLQEDNVAYAYDGNYNTYITCRPGDQWQTYISGSSNKFYEESVYWTVNISGSSGEEINVANISSSETDGGENWTLGCRAYDGYNYSIWVNSSLTYINISEYGCNYTEPTLIDHQTINCGDFKISNNSNLVLLNSTITFTRMTIESGSSIAVDNLSSVGGS